MITVLLICLLVLSLYILVQIFDIALGFVESVLRMFFWMLIGIGKAFILFITMSYKRLESLWRKV